MQKLFRLYNRAGFGQWVIAPDAEVAKDISLAAGHARSRENLRVEDQTDWMLKTCNAINALDMLNGSLAGIAAIQLQAYRLTDIFDAAMRPVSRWMLAPKYQRTV